MGAEPFPVRPALLAGAALLALVAPAAAQGGGKKPGPSPPTLQEADRVTGQADRDAKREAERARMLREHFRLCDLDTSGWISFREASATLGIDRDEYRRYDSNQDGRIDLKEFDARSRELLTLIGAYELPGPRVAARETPGKNPLGETFPRPTDLVARFDANRSSGLDPKEMAALFAEAGLDLRPPLVVAQMDGDDSGELEATELVTIAWLCSERMPESLRDKVLGKDPPPDGEPEELARELPDGPPPLPRPSDGPASHFRRLDPSGDGAIDEADLRSLLSPARLDLRLNAVLSALDRDGDGRLTEAEFRAAM